MSTESRFTSFLYASPSFFSGVARLFDFWGLFDSYNNSRNGRSADAKALYSDWRAVGLDVRKAMREYSRHSH